MTTENPIAIVKKASRAFIVALQYQELTTETHIRQLEETTLPLITKNQNLILDFTHVNFISSSLLGFLLKLKEQLQKQNGKLILTGLSTEVKNTPNDKYINELFKIVKLDTVFAIYDNIHLALDSVT